MENKMKEVANLLGVELEEEFKVYGWDGFCKITELGLERYVKETSWLMDSIMLTDLIKGTAKIIKIPKPILTEKEREYLSNVIKPFRDNVIGITKYEYSTNGEYIHIKLKRTISPVDYFIPLECIDLPIFKRGIIYKGMELMREYSLKELDL